MKMKVDSSLLIVVSQTSEQEKVESSRHIRSTSYWIDHSFVFLFSEEMHTLTECGNALQINTLIIRSFIPRIHFQHACTQRETHAK